MIHLHHNCLTVCFPILNSQLQLFLSFFLIPLKITRKRYLADNCERDEGDSKITENSIYKAQHIFLVRNAGKSKTTICSQWAVVSVEKYKLPGQLTCSFIVWRGKFARCKQRKTHKHLLPPETFVKMRCYISWA